MDNGRLWQDAVGVSGRSTARQQLDGGIRAPARNPPTVALFWRLFLATGLVFVSATAVLVFSPVTVSAPILLRELAVLGVGLTLLLAVNAFLLRAALQPLAGLTALMQRVDLLRPGQRAEATGTGDVAQLVDTFNQMLDRLEAERGASAAAAMAAQEGERQRIARELHDEVGQSLTAVLLELRRTIDRAPDGLRDDLDDVQEMVRTSLDEVRQVARRLRPGVLEDLGLVSAVSELASEFSRSTDVTVARRFDQPMPLTREAELAIYRIAQESLTNVARHARASHVDLRLTSEEDRVVLAVRDDGRGLNGAREGAGIRGMRERALLVGGNLTLQDGPTGGTVVRLDVPTGSRLDP
jgi:two-component system, NarL family, sensor histidine kinase UhpB